MTLKHMQKLPWLGLPSSLPICWHLKGLQILQGGKVSITIRMHTIPLHFESYHVLLEIRMPLRGHIKHLALGLVLCFVVVALLNFCIDGSAHI